jgi:hypothetical protein
LGAALRDPRFAGFCALSITIAAGNAVVNGHGSLVAHLVRFAATALLLTAFFLMLTVATPRSDEESQVSGRRARNAMFGLAAFFGVIAVLAAVLG